MVAPLAKAALFPYTTLFRSCGQVSDPEGNKWMIATHKAEPTPAQMAEAMRRMMQQQPHGFGHLRRSRSEEHTSELQSLRHLVCRLLLEKKNLRNRRALRASF